MALISFSGIMVSVSLLGLSLSVRFVPAGQQAVLFRCGRVVGVRDANWSFVVPIIDSLRPVARCRCEVCRTRPKPVRRRAARPATDA